MLNTAVEPLLVDPDELDDDYIHVVAAIIWKQGNAQQFLISQRQPGKHLEHYWELPGGKVEVDESPEQALRRELSEEIDIRVVSATRFMQVYHRYPERNILLDSWSVDDYRGEVIARENQALAWIDCMQTDAYRFPQADWPILDALRQR